MALATAPAGFQAECGKPPRVKTQIAAFSGGLDALGKRPGWKKVLMPTTGLVSEPVQ